jgi:hypothetical protein
MPLYYISTHGDGKDIVSDAIDLPDHDAAWREAAAASGEILRDMRDQIAPNKEWRMDVQDGRGEVLFRFRMVPESFV